MGSLPPLTADAIALTEKKMDMTLDDIIKMSKKTKQKPRKQRSSNKSQQPFSNKFGAMDNASKARVQQSVAARSSALRQAKLAEMRSRNGNNQFPAVKEAARRVATARSVARSVQGRSAARTVQGRSVQGRSVARSVQWNKRRNGSFSVQSSRAFPMVSSTQINAPMKQRPQTLDSLFANMKEQRLRAQAQAGGRQAQAGGRQTNFANNKRNFGGRQRNFDGYRRNFMGHQSQRANQV